jgi:hypothetical protein
MQSFYLHRLITFIIRSPRNPPSSSLIAATTICSSLRRSSNSIPGGNLKFRMDLPVRQRTVATYLHPGSCEVRCLWGSMTGGWFFSSIGGRSFGLGMIFARTIFLNSIYVGFNLASFFFFRINVELGRIPDEYMKISGQSPLPVVDNLAVEKSCASGSLDRSP